MKNTGTTLEAKAFDLSEAKNTAAHGLYLIVVPDSSSRHDIEQFRDLLQEEGVNALLILDTVLKEVRHLDKSALEDLRDSVNDALGLSWAADEATSPNDMTPERVITALEKKPKLLRGVQKLLHERLGGPPPEMTDEQNALMEKLFQESLYDRDPQ